ncbi:MAG: hypothetical protein ACKVQA_21275 [Burkholderiales bacterium]
MKFGLLVLALFLGGLLAWMHRRDQRRYAAWRTNVLGCENTPLAQCEKTIAADGFPVLRGKFASKAAEVRLFRDDATFRKLPSLWISVSLRADLREFPHLDILARSQNTEFYSPGGQLPYRLDSPPGWSTELTIKCGAPQASLVSLAPHAAEFFADARAKEILVTPQGVRLVYQLSQARRAEYLVLRAGHFEIGAVPPALLELLLARANAVANTISTHA